eukprot:13100960-Alexandrium_andersonii.AAC.1
MAATAWWRFRPTGDGHGPSHGGQFCSEAVAVEGARSALVRCCGQSWLAASTPFQMGSREGR